MSKRHMLSAFMSGLIVLQVFLAFLINQTLPFTFPNLMIESWHTIILFILIRPFEYYHFSKIAFLDEGKNEKLSKWLGLANLFCLVVSSFVVVLVWTVVDNYDQFKGQPDLIADFLNNLPISTKFLTLAYIFGSSYFFVLAFHFFFLIKGKTKLSILFLLLSLSFPMRMLIYFSRSNLILLLLLYIVYSILTYPVLGEKSKKAYKLGALLIFGSILIVASIISINKFGDVDSKSSIYDKEGTLYQFVNYASMWYPNMVVMNTYTLSPVGGELSDVIFDYWKLSGGKTNTEIRTELWPDYYYKFVPLPTVLVFDFGFILTFVIVCIISYIVYLFRPRKDVITMPSFLAVGVLSSIVIMNFAGSIFEDLYIHYAFIFLILIFMFYRRETRLFIMVINDKKLSEL